MYQILRRTTQGLVDETIKFAQELVSIPSPTLGEKLVASQVEKQMKAFGYDEVMQDEFGNVLGILYGREEDPTVVLTSHMDTVPADCSGAWGCDPYSARIEDGRLVGLGAADCKGGLAAQVAVGAILRRSLLPLRGNLVVAATVAEETGGSVGVRGLLSKTLPRLNLKPQMVLLGEPTSLGLYYGHDGWVEVDVKIESPNAFHVEDAARAIYTDLQREESEVARLAAHEEMVVEEPVFAQKGDGRTATVKIARRLTAPLQASHVIGQIHRSAQLTAQSMGRVMVKVDVSEQAQTLYTGTQTVVRKVVDAWQTDPFDPMLERARQCLSAAGCQARPGKWRLGRLGMGTAGGVITREFGLPALGYGPGDEEQAHRPGEFVDTNMIVEAAYGSAAIVHGLIGVPVLGWTADEI